MAPTIPGILGTPLVYQGKFLSPSDLIRSIIPPAVLPKLLGDYTDLILEIFAWSLVRDPEESNKLKFNLFRCNNAIQRLCGLKTHISNNILQMVSGIDKLNVGTQFGAVGGVEYIDFQQYCQLASEELKRRGKSSYDPSVYVDKKEWEL